MPLILPGNVASATASTTYDVANSCRFNSADEPCLYKAFGTPTSVDKWTISYWVKRGNISGSSDDGVENIWGTISNDGTYNVDCRFNGSDDMRFTFWQGSSTVAKLNTTQKFRDTSAWYHMVNVWDSGNATAGDRMKWYVNGVEVTSFSTDTNPSQDLDSYWNSDGSIATIGSMRSPAGSGSGNGEGSSGDYYLAEFVFCDGQAYAASDFGEFNEDSPTIWQPKDVSELTFGNNGFYLDFEDSSNLGNDANGGTDLTEVNLAAADQCVDSPTNNFATLNPLHMSDPSANYFVDNGNNTLEATNNDVDRLTGATIHPMGIKGYFEYKILTDNNCRVALQEDGVALTKSNYTALASGQFYGLYGDDITYANGGSSANHIVDYIDSSANGDIIGCAFDFTGSNRNVWWHLNGTYGNNGSGVGVPATGAYPGITSTQLSASKNFEFVFMCNTGSSSSSIALNFGNGSFDGTAISSAGTNASFGTFEYDVPSGFGPICTKTLNETYS